MLLRLSFEQHYCQLIRIQFSTVFTQRFFGVLLAALFGGSMQQNIDWYS